MSRCTDRLDKFNGGEVKAYRDKYVVSLFEAKRKCVDVCISEALSLAHGWEDLKAVLIFQHTYKGW
jgi:hypothetical protein